MSATFALAALVASYTAAQTPLKFMGRDVTVVDQGTDGSPGEFPKGPASLCLGASRRQCFTMPGKFGGHPDVETVEIAPGSPALLFSADNGHGSGTTIHLALLQARPGRSLLEMLPDISMSNLSQHAFWNEAPVSDSKIFVTAEFEWGPDEPHYGPHRYMISSYVRNGSSFSDQGLYHLEDRYMTAGRYDVTDGPNADVLAAEKPEILARLLRVKQQDSGVR